MEVVFTPEHFLDSQEDVVIFITFQLGKLRHGELTTLNRWTQSAGGGGGVGVGEWGRQTQDSRNLTSEPSEATLPPPKIT